MQQYIDGKLDSPQGSLEGQGDIFDDSSMDGLAGGLGDEDGDDSDGSISSTSRRQPRMDYGLFDWNQLSSLESDSEAETDHDCDNSTPAAVPAPQSLTEFLHPTQVKTSPLGVTEAKRKTQNKADHWDSFVSCITGIVEFNPMNQCCDCQTFTRLLPAISFNGMPSPISPLTHLGCVQVEFAYCNDTCSYRPAMLGFLSQGYYPSAPKRPKFAISQDILHFFHDMYVQGTTSKQAFCSALEALVRRKGDFKVQSSGNVS
jgi:hypothetical protein